MTTFIVTVGLGLLTSVLGVINMTGNISSLHSYHRKRVSEADRKPFGRLVGLGTLLIGIVLILYGVLFLVSEVTQSAAPATLGAIFLIVGGVLGIGISFYAMFRYNKGIF